MGLSSIVNRVQYTGDGSSTFFAFPYYFFNQADLQVYLYDINSSHVQAQTLNTNYTIAGNLDSQGVYPTGGSVVFNCSVPTTHQVVITRDPSRVQNYVLGQNGPINSQALVKQLDYLTALVQRLQDEVARAIKLPDGLGTNLQGAFDTTLPESILLNSTGFAPLLINSGATGFQFGTVGVMNGSGFSFAGILPVVNGGTGQGGGLTEFGVWYSASGSSMSMTAAGPLNQVLTGQGSSGPIFAFVNMGSSVTGILQVGQGGTGTATSSYITGGLIFASSGTRMGSLPVTDDGNGITTWPTNGRILLPAGSANLPPLAFANSGYGASGMFISASGASAWGLLVGGSSALNFLLSSGRFGNVGLGSNPSASDLFPLLASRNMAGAINAQLANSDSTAGSGAKWQLVVDGGNNTMEMSAFSAATTTPAAYGQGKGVIRAAGSLRGLSLVADNGSSYVDVFAGNNIEQARISRFNADGSFSMLQAIATPSVKAGSSSVKVYVKSDSQLYTMNSSGVESFLLPVGSGINARGDLIVLASSGIWTHVPAGSDGTVLRADSTQTPGVAWGTVSSLATLSVSAKTANYTMTSNDDLILVSSSGFTIQLPDATVAANKKLYRVGKTDSPIAQVIIQASGAQQIGSYGGSVNIMTQNEMWHLVPDGTNWQVVEHRATLPWTSGGLVTITGSGAITKGSTQAVDRFTYSRDGEDLLFKLEFRQTNSAGASAGALDYKFQVVPAGITINSAIVTPYQTEEGGSDYVMNSHIGSAMFGTAGAEMKSGGVQLYDSTRVRIAGVGNTNVGYVGAAFDPVSGNAYYVANGRVPIKEFQP